MEIEVAKKDLENALSVVSLAVGSGNDLSAHYLFRIRDDVVMVHSYDIRLFASSPIVCNFEGDEGDSFTVEAWRLSKWMDGVSDGVLKFTYDGKGEVIAKGSRSKIRLRSLDPSKWPHNDKLMGVAKEVGRVNPKILARALNLTRWFVSSDDTSKPELCQIEAVEGVVWATDRRALSSVEIPALPDLNIRVPGKDVASVVRFLSDKDCKEIVIKVSKLPMAEGGGENFTLWKGERYLGVPRPATDFPTLNVNRENDAPVKLEIDRDEFKAAIAVLSAGAPKGHESITFKFDPKEGPDGTVSVGMPCEAGGEDTYPLALAKVEGGDLWANDFTVDIQYIQGIGDVFGLDTLKFGVVKRKRGGFLDFRHTEEDADDPKNDYYSVIVWRT